MNKIQVTFEIEATGKFPAKSLNMLRTILETFGMVYFKDGGIMATGITLKNPKLISFVQKR